MIFIATGILRLIVSKAIQFHFRVSLITPDNYHRKEKSIHQKNLLTCENATKDIIFLHFFGILL